MKIDRSGWLPAVAAASLLIAFAWTIQEPGWTQKAHYGLVRALADGTPRIDEYHTETGDKSYVDGHFYSVKAPGLALVSVPPYLALERLGLVPESTRTAIWLLNLLTVVPLALLLCLAIRGPMRRLTGESTALPVAALSVGTLVLPFATLYFSHVPTAALGVVALALALRARETGRARWAALSGLAAGLAVVFEYPTALIALAIGAYLLAVMRPRLVGGVAYACGGVVGLIPLALYNWWAFGSPGQLSYEHVVEPSDWQEEIPETVELANAGLAWPSLRVLGDLLLSNRGLLTLTPVVAAGAAGVVLLWRRGRVAEAALLGVTSVVALLWNAGFTSAYGGAFGGDSPGPRYISAVVPLLIVPLGLVARRALGVVLALGLASCLTMALATSTKPQVGAGEEGVWLDLARAGDFTETPLTLLGVDNGWLAILPFFGAIVVVGAAAWVGSGRRLGWDVAVPAATASVAWIVTLLACPLLLERVSNPAGTALALLVAGGCIAVTVASCGSRSPSPPLPPSRGALVGPIEAVRTLPLLAWGLALVTGLAAAALFTAMHVRGVRSDFAVHAVFARELLASGLVHAEVLFYAVLAASSGFQADVDVIEVAMIAVLAVAAAAKFVVSAAFATTETRSRRTALLVAVALLGFAFSLPVTNPYLGQVPPNVFHNSTTIFVMPLALLLFWCATLYLRTAERRWLWWVCALAAVNVAAKPSFVIVMIVVFPVLAAVRLQDARPRREAYGATVLMAALLLVQYLYVYETDAHDRLRVRAGLDIVTDAPRLDLFDAWSRFSDSIPLSLVASLVFPLAAFAVYRRRLLSADHVQFALALFVVGVAVYALVAESGDMRLHGNFTWQAIISCYVLFVCVLTRVAAIWDRRREPFGSLVVAGAFLVHIVAGVAYLGNVLTERTFF